MSVQLPLPAGWARQFTSMLDPRDRLDALAHAKLSARTEVRKVLARLIDDSASGRARSIVLWISRRHDQRPRVGGRKRLPARDEEGHPL